MIPGMRHHSHETERAVEKLHQLERTADVGESPKTPLILLGEVWVVSSVLVAAILALSLLAYWLAS
jgi:5,10-methenyltetrahydromethanopterin hydrogenase